MRNRVTHGPRALNSPATGSRSKRRTAVQATETPPRRCSSLGSASPISPTVRDSASVVIVAYDSGPGLLGCVASVWADEPDWEVIVVDNGAGGAELEAVAAAGRVTIVTPPQNLGFGGGCNLGARVATCE